MSCCGKGRSSGIGTPGYEMEKFIQDINSSRVPSLEQLKNAGMAVSRVAENIKNKKQITVTHKVRASRLSFCKDCENKDGIRCRLCGCFINLKTRLTSEDCPAIPSLWSRVD